MSKVSSVGREEDRKDTDDVVIPESSFHQHIPAKTTPSGEGKLAMDIYETDQTLVFIAPMAGVDPKQVEVLLSEDVLTISGDRTFPDTIFTEEKTSFLEECYWGKFSRSVILPAAVNSEDMTAKFVKGLLVIEVPKAKKAKSKVVPIQVL